MGTDSTDTAAPVRPGDELDWPALDAYLHSHLDLPAEPMEVRQFTAGHANLTYLLAFGEQRVVFRRPPRGTIAPGAHDMAREHRMLSGLWRPYPRAPRPWLYCDDDSIVGASFVVVEHRVGEIVRGAIPETMAHHADAARRLSLALVDAMADLHTVASERPEFRELGRPDGFGSRQVSGWLDRWRRAAPADADPAMERIGEDLAATVPQPQRPAIVHNDLKFDNCQYRADDPDTVISVFDWDMATIGDPLFDVANLLVSSEHDPVWVLTREEVVERYSERSGMDLTGLHWYEAFATFRTGVVVQQLSNRYASGESSDERLAALGDVVPGMATRARALLEP